MADNREIGLNTAAADLLTAYYFMVTAVFFKDLSTCAYFARGVNVRAIGWLECGHPYRQGAVSAEFLAVLKAQVAIAYQVVHFLGSHSCSLCPKGQQRTGFRNLLVPTVELLYVAPELVVHYIEGHNYQPPEEFVVAMMACPEQNSAAYLQLLQPFEYSWTV